MNQALPHPPSFRPLLDDALRFWEPRRIAYNLVLAAIVIGWGVLTWPHFRPALALEPMLRLFVLAVISNVLYSTAYLVDLPVQASSYRESWCRRRWILWLVGTLFAAALTHYWIGDEIYPFVR